MDRILSEAYLGERDLDSYAGRWRPLIFLDSNLGKMAFTEDLYFQEYFQHQIFDQEKDFSRFFKSDLPSNLLCSNELLSAHFDEIRYSYRLLTLSYLMEGQWHLNMASKHFAQKNGCRFDFDKWVNKCRPQSPEMKKFVSIVKKYKPKYLESFPKDYNQAKWIKDYKGHDFNYYSHYRMEEFCGDHCDEKSLATSFEKVCAEDESLMTQICSETDSVYGLSEHPDAYNLLGSSNIINTYNKNNEALGCLRRFSMVMAHKEVHYPTLKDLFRTLRAHLYNQYQERFIQGRIFFYGSGKEFELKGLEELYVMDQPFKIGELIPEEARIAPPVIAKAEIPVSKVETKKEVSPVITKKKEIVEVPVKIKSAFLQAAELRDSQDAERVEVDMLKLKYDYVFTLNMINTLAGKLKNFMTREALSEMMTFDKLGMKEGPVPLLFLKYMIDMQEHTGLFNLVSILGNDFYVSNEIDTDFKTKVERIRLINDDSTNRQWQILILKP